MQTNRNKSLCPQTEVMGASCLQARGIWCFVIKLGLQLHTNTLLAPLQAT